MPVLVTGCTGFIAQYIVRDLLEQNYEVIGTVRSKEKGDTIERLFNNDPSLTLEVVEDIAAPDAFDNVFEKYGSKIKVILHTASPFHFNATDYENEMLKPALHGTRSVLESIKKYGSKTVERVVVTSSIAAIKDMEKVANADFVYTEESWNPITWEESKLNSQNAYRGSKKFAEKAAWDFWEENKNIVKFELTTVNPSMIFGPQLFDENAKGVLNTSAEVINSFLKSGPDADISALKNDFVDVRDVSKAHLLAFQKTDTVGKRLGLSSGQFNGQDLARILNERFPQLQGTIPQVSGDGANKTEPYAKFDNSNTKEILGFPFRGLEETLSDTVAQILKAQGGV
ncbi:SDR family oxidoreductase [Lachancea thermotolerans CBS 6340]|uniref:KLTH0F04026p n=1 Tax=Lachancea thermotolerans (strain ATCC 56472 / CBS 6340 / NRRL Y-8284) TaxID=559295 RepID=C5DKE5_LACTC|nr:KLTH0F04026p [Lachancea thermotolerans CBS 6340]CAR23946.1 KLTH0F04026p [Lachancea thermotolerans CBS 6340]